MARISNQLGIALVVFTLLFLLVYRLGAYALWDDEAAQSLFAEQVWRTGDTSAVVGKNIVAYNQGAELSGRHDRANPPLPAYLIAPFVGLGHRSTFWVRFPGALCGMAYCFLLLHWLRRAGAARTTWILYCIGLLGDVSFFLYCRQARYYGIVLLCSLAIAYLYLARPKSPRTLVGIGLLLFCLLASHTISFAGVAAVLAMDYFGWRRKSDPLTRREWLMLLAPLCVLGGLVLSIWNPFRTRLGGDEFANTLLQRGQLFWWNLRDLNRAEFGAGVLLLAAPFLGRRDVSGGFLRRGFAAVLVYCFTVAMISPKVVRISAPVADVRYLLPLLPLALGLSVITIRSLAGRRLWLTWALGIAAFHTNVLNLGQLLPEGPRSTTLDYLAELTSPPAGPYRACVEWMKKNMPAGSSIWVNPGYAAYPLMYHAPDFIYAWQFRHPTEAQFQDLPAIHFYGESPPDYFIAFGPFVEETRQMIQAGARLGYFYEPAATLNQYWDSVHRPSLLSHHFSPVTEFDRANEAIYVFRHVAAKPARLSN